MKCLLRVVFVIVSTTAFGQDISNFTQFFINPYTLNPSYAGIEGRTAIFGGYRKQWTSIQGAPTIANFSLHTPLTTKLNFGVSVTSDKRGITQVSAGMLTIGYAAIIDNTTSIRFGLSAGYGSNTVDLTNASSTVTSDPALMNFLSNNSFLIGNAGISFHKNTFHGGITMPNIFQPVYLSKDAFNVTALKPFQSVVIHASNRYYFNRDQNVFEPYLIYRLNNGVPSQIEAAAVVHLQHAMWIGASYKQQFGLSGLLGFKIQNQFAAGFSYSIKNGGANQVPAPSYEVQLGYLFGNKKKDANAYSFVDTHKEKVKRKTAAEIAAEKKRQQQILEKKIADDRKKHEELLAKQKAAQEKKNPPVVANNQVSPNKQQQQQQKVDPVPEKSFVQVPAKKDTTRGGPRMKQHVDVIADQQKPTTTDPQHIEEQEKIKRLETHADNPTEEHQNEVVHPHAERHEFVKKGSHHEEMDYGDYVIVGVFKGRPNAEHFSTGLNKMSFTSDFGYLTEKNLWYVYIAAADDINEAKAERDKYRKLKIFRDAWLLTVHK
ncbi:MAG TPA: PorP/SprF family type IX secretion system membrane protein [Cyclobacteriaceae bacterium]|nr:PorP/SprF family type IX secretion system membrane protein [Cyclobacteriaceae bacterium]